MGSEISFQDIAQLVRDVVHPNDVGDVPYIGLEHIEQGTLRLAGWGRATEVNSAKFRFRKGDVLFGKLRPYFRKVIRAPFDGVCSTDIWVVRARAGFDQGYLFYWMAAQDFVDFASSGSEGTRMPRAKWEHVAQFTRPRLSLPEQRAIARILGTLDDKIELNRRMNETLEAMAQALFKSWFVDFDPVVVNALRAGNPIPEKFAERAAHYRDNPDALGLPEELLRLFPARFVDSELGPIPEGWEIGRIDALCASIENGGTPKRMESRYWGGTIPWFKTGELSDGPLLESEERITSAGLTESSCKLWPVGTILIALYASPTVGRLGILEVPAAANQACSALLAKPDYGTLFVFYSLRVTRDRLRQIAVGAAQQNISQKAVRAHKVVVPRSSTARRFSELAGVLYRQRVQLDKESRTLADLRDTLLPKLISGELRVKDVEKILEDAV